MTQPLQTRCVKEALARVRILFMEPGAKLTTADAAQMAGLDRQVCRVLLQNLVEAGFLERRLRGVFVRSPSLRPHRQPPLHINVVEQEHHHHEWKSAPRGNPSTSAPHREAQQAARAACGGAGGRRAALEAKLQKTYAPGSGPQPSKASAHDAAAVPVPTPKAS